MKKISSHKSDSTLNPIKLKYSLKRNSKPKISPEFSKIGIIGLGIMGGIMAETLIQSGYEVMGYDVNSLAMKRLQQAGGAAASSVTELSADCSIVIVSLATSKALNDVVTELTTSIKSTKKSCLVLETSTLPLEDKEAAHALLSKVGAVVMDCPISGTAARMKDRAWTIYISGPKKQLSMVQSIFRSFTDNVPYVGEYGCGTKMKYAANHLVAIYNVAYAEVVTFARKMNLDPAEVLKLFGNSPVLGTGVMRLRMPFMIERNYSPPTMKIEVWQKDMQVIGDMAKSVNCPLPLFTACAPIYTSAMSQGLALQDTASTAEVLGSMAGIKVKKKK
jgi:3-hydroxyisobutyrate dehydrogenase-like beta-hydroxyacid dehydrogenase